MAVTLLAPVIGCRLPKWGGVWNPWVEHLSFGQEQYLGEGDSCELLAANTPHSWGMDALADKEDLGGTLGLPLYPST